VFGDASETASSVAIDAGKVGGEGGGVLDRRLGGSIACEGFVLQGSHRTFDKVNRVLQQISADAKILHNLLTVSVRHPTRRE
jgi:hypothetical protein